MANLKLITNIRESLTEIANASIKIQGQLDGSDVPISRGVRHIGLGMGRREGEYVSVSPKSGFLIANYRDANGKRYEIQVREIGAQK